ncbi:MAG: hypothetical protein KAJ73_10395, partial [Zetaproteobacteria bacterium]|nr:hypothetical protein [Zetaproteobacteria bacterium]
MEEVLQKLLEADVLSADTKIELEEAFNSKIETAITEAKELATAETKVELAEQWNTERDSLIEAIDNKVTEFLNSEMTELREDINRFRDLEVEYATKLTEAKSQMGDELKGDLSDLVEKVDTFLEIRLNSELEELREDIQVQKENVFGRKIFEAIAEEFQENYASDGNLAETLSETKLRLSDTSNALKEAETKLNSIEREQKLSETLSPLSGKNREVMEAILKNVTTDQLDEGYKTFIGRVLKENKEEKTIIKEDKEENKEIKKRKLTENTKIVTGK